MAGAHEQHEQSQHRQCKNREAAYQYLCAEIMREARDLPTLAATANRAFAHPDVQQDPELAAMLRGFIAERQAEFEARVRERRRAEEPEPEPIMRPFQKTAGDMPTRAEIVARFERCRAAFEDYAAQFDEVLAREALNRLEDLHRRFPVHVDKKLLEQCQERYQKLVEKRNLFLRQLDELSQQAAGAAQAGDQRTAAWVTRRLGAVRRLLPGLLSDEQLRALTGKITQGEQAHEQREVVQGLVARERAVAEQIRRIGVAVHRFHKVAAHTPRDEAAYRLAWSEYAGAVDELRHCDGEWLTGLMLELQTLLDDLHDPAGRAETQVHHFLETVRTTLEQVQQEIRTIQQEQQRPGMHQ